MHTALAHEHVKQIMDVHDKGLELNTWIDADKETLCWVILQLDREIKSLSQRNRDLEKRGSN